MELERIVGGLAWTDFVILRLLRRWVATRTLAETALPSLIALAEELGEQPESAISLHSVFQLTESCLGRPLEAECCCSRELAADERAILALVAAAPQPGAGARGSPAIPHGLAGALCWAVMSARIALGVASRPVPASRRSCPFEHGSAAIA